MFTLIISIASIALVVALVVATMYFGGDVLTSGGTKLTPAAVINDGGQFAGALEAYKAETGAFPVGTSDQIKQTLIDEAYLNNMPDSAWKFEKDYLVKQGIAEKNCLQINQKLGINTIPSCADAAYAAKPVCCLDAATP